MEKVGQNQQTNLRASERHIMKDIGHQIYCFHLILKFSLHKDSLLRLGQDTFLKSLRKVT